MIIRCAEGLQHVGMQEAPGDLEEEALCSHWGDWKNLLEGITSLSGLETKQAAHLWGLRGEGMLAVRSASTEAGGMEEPGCPGNGVQNAYGNCGRGGWGMQQEGCESRLSEFGFCRSS